MRPADVRAWGISQPVYYWQGRLIDGRKLARAARLCGVEPLLQVDLETEEEAQRHLGRTHPERALKLWPCSSASEAAERFGLPLSRVARFFQPAPRAKRPQARKRRTGKRTRARLGGPRKVEIYLAPHLRATVDENSESIRVSMSDYIRGCILVASPQQVQSKLIAVSIAEARRAKTRGAERV